MYLKELTLFGFKSFAERTTLHFQPGVTAIVGPNGCGKSNVSDAVRWVLGEQSAKALRGGEMADVIFNGTDTRKPLGMAEVSLTISDIKQGNGTFTPIPGVPFDYTEVTVTRRVFRDGQSQYFINKTPCRLRDIQQLFWDTGIGRTAYSIMEQGKIDLIISSHPEDRRLIFEEAAGITKFKHQKKEALRKLEYTEANLLRVTDIIREVKRQIGSLQRQAGKARRYKELHEQLKRLDCALARHKYDLLAEEINSLSAQSSALDMRIRQTAAAMEADENALTQLRREIEVLDQKIHQLGQREYEARNEAARAHNRIESNVARIAEFQSLTKKHEQDIANARLKMAQQEEVIASLNAQLESFSTTLIAAEAHLKEQQEALRAANEKLRAAEESHRAQQDAVVALDHRITTLHNEMVKLESLKREETLRFEQLSAEKREMEEQLVRLAARRGRFHKELEAEKEQVEVAKRALRDAEQECSDATAKTSALRQLVTEKANQLAAARARLQFLEQIRQKHLAERETLVAELKKIVQADGEPDANAVLAVLSQVISVKPDYSAAVEAALGNHLQAILVRDSKTAEKICAGLDGQHNRMLTLAPMDWASQTQPFAPSQVNGDKPHPEGALCWAADIVTVPTEYRPLVRRLLDGVVIAPQLPAAIAVYRASQGTVEVATLGGEFVDRRGLITLGHHADEGRGQLVSQSEIAEVADAVARLVEELQKLQVELAQADARQSQAETALQQARQQVHALEVALATRRGEFGTVENEWREARAKFETISWELKQLGEQHSDDKQRREQIQSELLRIEREKQEAVAKLGELAGGMEGLRLAREDAWSRVTDAKAALAAQQQKRDTLLAQQTPAIQRARELGELVESRQKDIEEFSAKIRQLTEEIEESKRIIATSQTVLETIKGEVEGLGAQRRELVRRIETQEAELKEKRKTQDGLQSQKSELEIHLAGKRMEMQNIAERVARDYQVNIESIRGEGITITLADTGQPQKTEVGPSELAAAGLAPDWAAIEQQVVELRARLESMGPVNLEAIGEYEELEQRHKFLTEQHEDLTKSQQQLMQLISKINTETRRMFSETFEKVRTNFQEVFTELFGGGKANLILADESDPLECGIEIVAKPPGKQLQSISLLSGGEKALTAIALLFSIYMVKPSPFCLLDEIDAPLDESNINRFIKMLQRFLSQSQFVLISHNKRTISMADAIYGVTMEEHGVSKIVSVKFTKKSTAPAPVPQAVAAAVSPTAVPGSTVSKAGGVLLPVAAEPHAPGHEPIHNDLLNEHESRRAPVTTPLSMESFEPESDEPDDAEITASVVDSETAAEGDKS